MPSPARSAPTSLVSLLTLSSFALGLLAPTQQAAANGFGEVPPAPSLASLALAPEQAPAVGFEIDAKALGSEGGPLADKLQGDLETQRDGAGFRATSDPRDPVILIVIERASDPEKPGYMVGLSMETGDEIVSGSARQSDCSLCTRTELVTQIGEEVENMLDLAREHQVPAVVEPGDTGGEEEAGEGGEDEAGEDGGEPGGKKLGTLGIAGIGVGVVGLLGVGAGVGLVVVGERPIADRPFEQRNYKPGGFAALAVGSVALVTGVVLVALDAKKRGSKSGKSARLEWRGAGLAF